MSRWPPTIELYWLLLHICNFASIMNYNVDTFGDAGLSMRLWPTGWEPLIYSLMPRHGCGIKTTGKFTCVSLLALFDMAFLFSSEYSSRLKKNKSNNNNKKKSHELPKKLHKKSQKKKKRFQWNSLLAHCICIWDCSSWLAPWSKHEFYWIATGKINQYFVITGYKFWRTSCLLICLLKNNPLLMAVAIN